MKLTKPKLRSLMRVMFLALLASVILPSSLWAQARSVTGVVTDPAGEPLIGALVAIEGAQTSVITSIDGSYSIDVPAGPVQLRFTYVGMIAQTLTVGDGQTVLDVTLLNDSQMLEDVVVIGYGTVKRRDLTGSVASVGGDRIAAVPVASAAEAITGKLPGVQVTTTEGSPDAEIKIRVRGGGSITQDNSPLYIVDGFPVNTISDIPPTSIQSIDVLKDASSTAIYGARGANGVIIVTTKGAQEGKFTVSYNGYFGIKNVTKMLEVMDPYEFAFLNYEQAVLRNQVDGNYEPYYGTYADIDLYKSMKGTDWQDVMFGRTGTTRSHNVSATGGTDKASYALNYTRLDDKAIMLGSDYSRDYFNARLNAKPLKWLKLDVSARYTITEVYGAGANDVSGSERSTNDARVRAALGYTPIPLKNMTAPDDEVTSLGDLYPPTVQNVNNDRQKKSNRLNLNAGISVNLIPQLVLRTEGGLDHEFSSDDRFFGPSTYAVRGGGLSDNSGLPAAQLSSRKGRVFRNANTLTYSDTFKEDHSLSVMVGQEMVTNNSNSITSVYDNMPEFFDSQRAWNFSTQGRAVSIDNKTGLPYNMFSVFGRANYAFRDKYLLSATFRYDGSSKFGPGRKWGFFPSVAAAWRIIDEKFMQNSGWLSDLKLRVSYGEAGNDRIDGHQYMQVYSSSSTTYLPWTSSIWGASNRMANENIKWETTVTRNIGLDYGFWNNRISGSLEYYMNNTKDLLIAFPTSGSGYDSQIRNIGETSNRGFEANLNAVLVDTRDFHLDLNFNISFNKNKVVSLGGVERGSYDSAWTKSSYGVNEYLVREGEPIGQMWGYVSDGMYSVDDFDWNGTQWVAKEGVVDNSGLIGSSFGPGGMRLRDLDGDGVITTGSDSGDKRVIGNASPKHIGGFGLSAGWKGIDFSAVFNWVYGNSILNANKIEMTSTAGRYNRNIFDTFSSEKRFTHIDKATGLRVTDPATLASMNAGATVWSPIIDGGGTANSYALTSWAIEDGSFLRLGTLTLGYTFPSRWMEKIFVQSLRIYATGYNLLTITGYSGFDPEVDSRRSTPLTPGVDYSAYPKSRSFIFGVNLTF